ncbi:MAG: hypothetical protein COU68_02720, partial [Candidatus Pacebacteria bacterium CG10_big_fil_rev_8_21_14_0_10_45_6]
MNLSSRLQYHSLVFRGRLRYYWYRMRRLTSRRNRLQTPSRRIVTTPGLGRGKLLWFKLLRFVALAGMISIVLGIILFFVLFAWFSRSLPKPGEVIRHSGFSTKIFDRNGVLLYDLFDQERRTPVIISELPDDLLHATIATEDKDFYKHGGFDMLTVLRIP